MDYNQTKCMRINRRMFKDLAAYSTVKQYGKMTHFIADGCFSPLQLKFQPKVIHENNVIKNDSHVWISSETAQSAWISLTLDKYKSLFIKGIII